jgi:predicted transposase/invertase (TIGR01784 family)
LEGYPAPYSAPYPARALVEKRSRRCYIVYVHTVSSPDILPPIDDWIFKLLFGDERNKSILIALLASFIELPEEEYEITFLDTYLKPEAEDDKLGIVDVKVKTKSGKVINIEIQVNPVRNIGKRLSFYKSKLIVEQISKAEMYSVIQRVICVCITDYTLFPDTCEYMNRFVYMNPLNGLVFEDIPEEVYTLELPKLPSHDDGSRLWDWLCFLRSKEKEEFEMVAERNHEVRRAVDTLYELSSDERVRAEYDMRLKAWCDRLSEIEGSFQDGIQKGRAEGEECKALDIARNMVRLGLSFETVVSSTKLDPEKVKALYQ